MTPQEDLADRRAFVDLLGELLGEKPTSGRVVGEKSALVKKSAGKYGDMSGYSEEELKSLYRQAKQMNNKPAFIEALRNEAERRNIILY